MNLDGVEGEMEIKANLSQSLVEVEAELGNIVDEVIEVPTCGRRLLLIHYYGLLLRMS